MNINSRPRLKTRQFSTLHIEILEQLLVSGKSNRDLNQSFGYTKRSHCVVDHSRKVMHKLLALEKLSREDNKDRVIYPRTYKFWWKGLLDRHRQALLKNAIAPAYYEDACTSKFENEQKLLCM
ncbi:hypothetical protein [Mucilaginibacter lappiensis]|uniref:Uncharacterized protein n=1 Tax=Mucilaginibacter lappiensis TaxID=354630 RepID=A0A841JI68_9SPHI|nr:hypothetical protein [Mucilaginibacter lappiensis]MBB6130630.1 hypothetical protein [Mucilaginibacter lappiensis]